MNTFAQMILTDPALSILGSALVAGVGFTLKKVFDIDRRLAAIEARCQIHRRQIGHPPDED